MPGYEFIVPGGKPSANRHDPTGHEDCSADWEPCLCHGDRLCRLGMLIRWHRSAVWWLSVLVTEYDEANAIYEVESQLAYREGLTTNRVTVQRRQDAWLKKHQQERTVREFERDLWPLIVANARQEAHA